MKDVEDDMEKIERGNSFSLKPFYSHHIVVWYPNFLPISEAEVFAKIGFKEEAKERLEREFMTYARHILG